jgi:hypothetical protein
LPGHEGEECGIVFFASRHCDRPVVFSRQAAQLFQYLMSLGHDGGFLLMSTIAIVWTTPPAMPSRQSALSVPSSHAIKPIAFCNRIAGS